ncbi:MAG: thiosulfate oxidation carrier complex protein SoxZ [Proteobacteria bacterium]|nr:MAG: thiosulfate oxidation carrier complex protein SoxZ [Pseudomonadota bacterium]
MGKPMRIRAKANGEIVEVRVLMNHVMETGQRKDQQGEPIPALFIRFVTITHAGRTVLSAQWGPAVSANPFLSFKFKGGASGEKIAVMWEDSRGDTRSDEAIIA